MCAAAGAVPGVQVVVDMPDRSFEWEGSTYHVGPASLLADQRKIRSCELCRGCRQALRPMPKGARRVVCSAGAAWCVVCGVGAARRVVCRVVCCSSAPAAQPA
jgi:hypothetical protein